MFTEIITALGALTTTGLGILASKNKKLKPNTQITDKRFLYTETDKEKLRFAQFVVQMIAAINPDSADALTFVRFGTMYGGFPYTESMKMKMTVASNGTVFKGQYGVNHRFSYTLDNGSTAFVVNWTGEFIKRGSFGAMADLIKWLWLGQQAPVKIENNKMLFSEQVYNDILVKIFEEYAPEYGQNGAVCSVACSITRSFPQWKKFAAAAAAFIPVIGGYLAAAITLTPLDNNAQIDLSKIGIILEGKLEDYIS